MPQIFKPSDTHRPWKYKKRSVGGRPKDSTKTEAFLKIANYLENNDDEQITVNDLIDRMAKYTKGEGRPRPIQLPTHEK